MEGSLEEKQSYLYNQIIVNEYDPEQFQEFMDNEKGLDLNEYTMGELKDVVRQFRGSILEPKQGQSSENPFDDWDARNSPEKQATEQISKQIQKDLQKRTSEVENTQNKQTRRPTKVMDPQQYAKLMGLPKSKVVTKNSDSAKEPANPKKQQRANTQHFYTKPKDEPKSNENTQKQFKSQTQVPGKSTKVQPKEEMMVQEVIKKEPRKTGREVSLASVKSFNSTIVKSFIITQKLSTSQLYKDAHLQKQQFTVKVRSFSKNQTSSLFKVNYITYMVESSNGWKVHRRFNDFGWIYRYLKAMYVGLPIPPIPQKTTMRSFNDDHLQQRMIIFERFLNKAVQISEICSDPVLEMFLSVESSEKFSEAKQKFDGKVKGKQNVICCLEGDQKLTKQEKSQVSREKKDFYDKSSQYLSVLNEELNKVETYLKLASQKAVNATNIFRELTLLHKENQVKGAGVFDVMGEFISEVGYKLDNEYYHLRNYIDNVLMYEQKYRETIFLNIDSLEKEKQTLNSKFKGISKENEEIKFEEGEKVDIENRQMTEYLKAKELYRIKCAFLSEEMKRHEQNDLVQIAKEWMQGMKKYMEQTKDAMMSGVDQLTKAMCISEGRDLMEVELLSPNSQKNHRNQSMMIREV